MHFVAPVRFSVSVMEPAAHSWHAVERIKEVTVALPSLLTTVTFAGPAE